MRSANLNILHFLPVYAPAWQFGGPILSVSRLCEALVRRGINVRVITTNAGLPEFPKAQLCAPQDVNGVKVTYYPVDSHHGPIRSKSLIDDLSTHFAWADILHLSSIWQPLGLSVQQAAHDSGVPVIQTLRGALGPYSWRRGWWKKIPYYILRERPLLQLAAALHCTTAQEVRELGWLHLKPPTYLLPNPIDLPVASDKRLSRDDWRSINGIPTKEPLFLVVGRFHHKKGLEILPDALCALTNRSWQIAFIGHDEDGTGLRLRNAFEHLGLANRCHWLETLPASQLNAAYHSADWLLLPSRHENFGNVVVEALACGCGVLISDRVGVAETIEECPGVTISPRSSLEWTASLQSLLAISRPGESSADWIRSRFSQDSVALQAKLMYEALATHG